MFAHLNYAAIAVATIAYFIIGSLWYSVLFGKQWMQLVNLTVTEEDKKNMAKMFTMTFVMNFIISLATASIIYFVQPNSLLAAIKVAALIGFGFVAPICIINYLYAKRPVALIAIDAGYHIAGITAVSIILAYWH